MAKNIFKVALKVIILVIVYLLQIYVINNTTLFGVNGDLCLMAVVLIALMEKSYVAYIIAGICGIVSDILFSGTVCKYVVIYIIVVSVLIGLKKMYKQDSKVAIIIFSIAGSVISEVLMFIFNVISKAEFVNIFTLIFMIVQECIVNICLAFLLYLVLRFSKREGK